MRLILVLMGAALMLCAACGGGGGDSGGGGGEERPAVGELAAVASVPEFAQEFNRARGHARLVLLLSPT